MRNCKTCFLDYNQELENLFATIVEDFNRNHSGWNYDITNIETIQLTHYFKGDFYDWHVDTLARPIIRNGIGHNRKVSATIFLNDPEEYEGGEFDLEVRGPKQNRNGASKGFGTKIKKQSKKFYKKNPILNKSDVAFIKQNPGISAAGAGIGAVAGAGLGAIGEAGYNLASGQRNVRVRKKTAKQIRQMRKTYNI